jgi:6-phosphogluconolactonase (cycloisomerase 2 family)
VGSGSCSSSAGTSGNFYVLNIETSQIVGYYVNSSGSLETISGGTVALPTTAMTGSTIAVALNNAFLYVSTTGGIYVYTISSTGALTLGNGGSAISADQATSMQVDSTNTWLVEAAATSGAGSEYVLYAIKVNSSNGVLSTAGESEQYQALPSSAISVMQLAISPDNSYVFVAMDTVGTAVVPFTSGNANPLGSVGYFSPKNTGGAALSVAVDPTNRLYYVGETVATSGSNTGGLRAFTFSSLPTISEISGSPFASQGLAPYSILPISTGDYVYVANRQVSGGSTGVIAGFTVAASGSSYSLTALGSTFTAGTNPVALAEDNTHQYVFAVDVGGDPDLMGYTIDSGTGTLTSAVSGATGSDPVQAGAIAAEH